MCCGLQSTFTSVFSLTITLGAGQGLSSPYPLLQMRKLRSWNVEWSVQGLRGAGLGVGGGGASNSALFFLSCSVPTEMKQPNGS